MKKNKLNNKVKFNIFDKTFKLSNGIYGVHRYKDDNKLAIVRNNYRAIRETINADNLLILKHVHGNTVIDSDLIVDFTNEPEADGAVASKSGTAITIQSADCVPILLASNDGKVIGGAHCGWRSTIADVLKNVVHLMQIKGAVKIDAIIGPSIHQQFYEVDQKYYDTILSYEKTVKDLFIRSSNADRYLFDLPGFVKLKLNKLGIINIINMCEDTYSNPDRFYSYRRDVHLGITDNQNNILSTILIS